MAKARKKKFARSGEPSAQKLSLRKLVAKIDSANRYPEISTGPAVGKEVVEWGAGTR